MNALRIAVADDEPLIRRYFAETLPALGHEVVAQAADGRQLVAQCLATQPDLVITDIKMPELDGIAAAEQILEAQAVPIILVSAYHDQPLLERADAPQIMAYLVKPISQADLQAAITLARRRFEQYQTLAAEAANLRQGLADRKLIERAKGLLMQRLGLSETDAFRRLQKSAADQNRKLVDVARRIVEAEGRTPPPRKP